MQYKQSYIKNLFLKILISFVFLFSSCFFIFIHSYGLLKISDWKSPLGYQGDMWLVLSLIKGYMDGDTFPLLFKFIPNLNAPFIANWNDYPITEEILFYLTGMLAKVVGLYPATTFLLFLSHFLSLISFFYVARYFKIQFFLALAGAFIFAFSHFILLRGIGHIVVGFVFHIPLILLVLSWCHDKTIQFKNDKRIFLAFLIAFLTGILNPYYSIMFCQLLLFSVIYFLINKRYSDLKFPLSLIFVTFFSFLLMNIDTILYGFINGTNVAFSHRNIPSLEIYSLKLPDMIFASGYTHLWGKISEILYHSRTYIKGEYWSPYLGIVGIIALLFFLTRNILFLFKEKLSSVSVHFWYFLWIIIFSITGGVNLIIGSFGFTLLRATNRYSIIIFVIVLLYLLKFISERFSLNKIIIISILLFSISAYEELYPRFKWNKGDLNPIQEKINEDQKIIWSIENINEYGKVFQLPVTDFPEVGPLNDMGDYENLRPYLNSKNLHFSHGSNKGRGDTDWQKNVEKMETKDMLSSLKSYGFDFIILNKKGYKDNGAEIIKNLSTNTTLLYESNDLISFRINEIDIENIRPMIIFNQGWSEDEITHRWSMLKKSEITIHNFGNEDILMNIKFDITSLRKSQIELSINDHLVTKLDSEPGKFSTFSNSFKLEPGKTIIRFQGNKYPILAGVSDRRFLTFALYNLDINFSD